MFETMRAMFRASFGETPKPGEIYEFDNVEKKDNPFENRRPFKVQVVKVLNNYVKYRYMSCNASVSLKLKDFRFCYKKVK